MKKIINDLYLLYLFISGRHWIYQEREVLLTKKPKPKVKPSKIIVIQYGDIDRLQVK